jgi:hypothetical protein
MVTAEFMAGSRESKGSRTCSRKPAILPLLAQPPATIFRNCGLVSGKVHP